MKKTLWGIVGVLTFFGLIIMAMFFIWPDAEFTVIEPHEINYFGTYTWKYYTFDIYRYIRSVQTSIDPKQLIGLLPNFPDLPKITATNDVLKLLEFLAKILVIFIPNILIFFLNLCLWPIKLLIYPIHVFSALLGIDTNNIDTIHAFEYIWALQIPMIPQW